MTAPAFLIGATLASILSPDLEAPDLTLVTGGVRVPVERLREDERTELVLLDVQSPKIDGLQVLERLRDDERTELVPVILFSSSREDIVEGYRLGANSYVTKPVNFDSFFEAMRYLGWYWLNPNESPESVVHKDHSLCTTRDSAHRLPPVGGFSTFQLFVF